MPITSYPQSDAAQPSVRASWTGLAGTVFSFPVMCVFLLAAAILWLSARAIAEPDIWWHLRNAAYLFQYHSVPRVDMYSFGAAGSPRLGFEWLSEVPFFLGFKTMGLQGLLTVYFAVLVLIYAGVYYRSFRACADCITSTVVTFLAVLLGIVSIGPRPLLFGWLCMVALLLVLDHFQRTGKRLWLLPPLFALWINLHGSWIFGMVVLVLTIAAGLVEGEWGLVVARRWSPGELKKLLLVLVTSLAALFVNPFGYKLVLYPFDLLFRQGNAVHAVEEWHSVDFSKGSGKLAMIVIFALLAAALFSRRKWKLDEVLVMAFALWAALSHVRFLFFVGLIVAPMLASRMELSASYDRELDKPWLNAAIMAAVVGLLIFLFPSAAQLQQQVSEAYPTAALEFMQRQHMNGRIFNNDGWGGYMEWTAPELKPFTDSRADIFVYNSTFDDYIKAVTIESPFEVLDKYQIDYVLLESKEPLGYVLEHSPAWRPIYSDKVAVLFQRSAASPAGK
ncbi:MAG: hypothetical protein ABSD98_19040 [Candidatus Korobacteraceae bacterium]